VTKKRQGALLTALTLLLSIAVITTAIAVPQLHPIEEIAVAEAQTLKAAAAGAGAGEKAPVQQAQQSPAYITVSAPAPGVPIVPDANYWTFLTGDTKENDPGSYPYQVWEHDKDALNNQPLPGHNTAKEWHGISSSLDILSSFTGMKANEGHVTTHHPAVRNSDLDSSPNMPILIPGCAGQYKFTLQNTGSVDLEYLISLEDFANLEKFPLRYRLTEGAGNVLTGSGMKYMDDIDDDWLPSESNPGKLVPGGFHIFTLDWVWEYEREAGTPALAGNDDVDTMIGHAVGDGLPTTPGGTDGDKSKIPQYQVKLNLLVRAPTSKLIVKLDPKGGTVVPNELEYNSGDTFGSLNIPTPSRPGFKFKGWVDKNGKPVDLNDPVYETTLTATWEEDPVTPTPGGWNFIPLPIPLPLPLPIPLPISLPASLKSFCFKCFRPADKCICAKDNKKSEPFAKTGDSTTAVFGALTMLAISGGIALFLYRKRREEDE